MIRSHNCWSVSVYGAMYFPTFCTVEEVWMLTPMGLSENRVIILYIYTYHIISSFSDRPKYDIKLLIHLICSPMFHGWFYFMFFIPCIFPWWNDMKKPLASAEVDSEWRKAAGASGGYGELHHRHLLWGSLSTRPLDSLHSTHTHIHITDI